MKTLAVIGANGKTGRVFVAHALAQGYHVRAGVHSPRHSLAPHDNLEVVVADATASAQLQALFTGCDAVVSLIGHSKHSSQTVQSDTMQAAISAMHALGIRRIISLTGTGVRIPGDTPSFIDKLLNTAVALVDPARVRDGKRHAEILQASDLDWTIMRVLKLTNTTHSAYPTNSHGPARILVARSGLAETMLDYLDDTSSFQKMPIIS